MAKDKMAISASLKQVNKRGGSSQQWMSCSLLLSSFVFISLQDHKAQRKKTKLFSRKEENRLKRLDCRYFGPRVVSQKWSLSKKKYLKKKWMVNILKRRTAVCGKTPSVKTSLQEINESSTFFRHKTTFYGEVKSGKYLISGLHLALERIWGLAGQLGWE